jgi:hypothetical protein
MFECTILTSDSKLEFINSVEAQHRMELINIFHVQFQIYYETFFALTDANSSII